MSVRQNNTYRANEFWGLVEQKGPWETTPSDRKRSYGYTTRKAGGGIGIQQNTGNANGVALITPHTISGKKPPPKPSKYAQRSVVFSKDYQNGTFVLGKRRQQIRNPFYSRQKMGRSERSISIGTQTEIDESDDDSSMEVGVDKGIQIDLPLQLL